MDPTRSPARGECADDPHVERKNAATALARFVRLHPHNIAQKTEVMVEHFNTVTSHRIGGRAKAMVVTGSRLEAVRYKQSFDRYIAGKGYPIKSLVAFSGEVRDDLAAGVSYTEEQMNAGIREKELPEHFATPEYQVLLVAEKFQTGFDQPLLHTMYVDKRLAGIEAVQTLSRLNRTHRLKEDTFVLDFVNDRDEIREAFATYYQGAEIGAEVDPARMYAIKAELDASGVYLTEEVERFCAVYFKPRQRQSPADHQAMNAALDPAGSRFATLLKENETEAEAWRRKMYAFRDLYGFLSQVIPYQDSDLERLYVYLRHLAAKLPRRRSGTVYQFDDDVRLEYYRLQKIGEGSISLGNGDGHPLDGPTEVGSGAAHEESVPLSQLIDIVNQRFGTDFNKADQLFFDQIVEAAVADDELRQTAEVNPEGKFDLVFRSLIERLLVERIDQNEDIYVPLHERPPVQGGGERVVVITGVPAAAGCRPSTRGTGARRLAHRRRASRRTLRDLRSSRSAGGGSRRIRPSADRGGGRRMGLGRGGHRTRAEIGHVRRPSHGPFHGALLPDGAYALFRSPVEGSRQGKTVLVQLRGTVDPETGARYTLKRYQSERNRSRRLPGATPRSR